VAYQHNGTVITFDMLEDLTCSNVILSIYVFLRSKHSKRCFVVHVVVVCCLLLFFYERGPNNHHIDFIPAASSFDEENTNIRINLLLQ